MNTDTARRVLEKVNRVCRSGTLLKLEVEWLEDASRAKAFRKMNRDEQNEYLDFLYRVAQLADKDAPSRGNLVKPELRQRAAYLYQDLRKSVL